MKALLIFCLLAVCAHAYDGNPARYPHRAYGSAVMAVPAIVLDTSPAEVRTSVGSTAGMIIGALVTGRALDHRGVTTQVAGTVVGAVVGGLLGGKVERTVAPQPRAQQLVVQSLEDGLIYSIVQLDTDILAGEEVWILNGRRDARVIRRR